MTCRAVGELGGSQRRGQSPVGRARAGERAWIAASDGVLLTGATGFVGMELLARYLERTDRRVYALVRGADDREVAARMRAYAAVACSAPITPMRSGWSRCVAISRAPVWAFAGGLDGLAERVSEIVHGAAYGVL